MKQTARDILGSSPWTDDQLTRAYFADFVGIHRALQQHPGYRLHAELEAFALSKRLFDFAVNSLKQAVEGFRKHSSEREFRTRAMAATTELTILAVQAAVFQAATTASAFRARALALSRRIRVPQFDQHLAATFAQSDRHNFVQELRDHLSHVAPLPAEWELSRAGRHAPQVAKFLLYVDDLSGAAKQGRKGWRQPARRFIEAHRNPSHADGGYIDVVELFAAYRAEVGTFYTWTLTAAEHAAGTPLLEYRDVQRRFHKIATRVDWRSVMIPWLSQTPDPWQLLKDRLTADELAVVDGMQTGSKEQLDQIIKFINDAEFGFVDAEIKHAIYRVFGFQ